MFLKAKLEKHRYLVLVTCATLLLLISYGPLLDYLKIQSRLTLYGMAIVPFSILVQKNNFSHRFSYWLIGFGVFYLFVPLGTINFICVWFALMLLWEVLIGRVNTAAFFIPFVHSSFISSFVNIVGFPLRVLFTKLSGFLIQLFSHDIAVSGSVVNYQGKSFFVDTACAGIMMISVSFVLFFIVYSQRERKTNTTFSIYQTAAFIGVNIGFILFSNFFRILLLILLEVPIEHYLHDVIGIVSLLLFHTLPLIFFFKTQKGKINTGIKNSKRSVFGNVLTLVAFAIFIGVQLTPQMEIGDVHNLGLNDIKRAKRITCNVAEIANANTTIYYKYQNPFMLSNHNPMACWRYGGYKIMNEDFIKVGGSTVCTALLDNGKETLFTCWWYDTENIISATDWKWRIDNLLENKKTVLINVSSRDKDEMLFEVNKYLGKVWKK